MHADGRQTVQVQEVRHDTIRHIHTTTKRCDAMRCKQASKDGIIGEVEGWSLVVVPAGVTAFLPYASVPQNSSPLTLEQYFVVVAPYGSMSIEYALIVRHATS